MDPAQCAKRVRKLLFGELIAKVHRKHRKGVSPYGATLVWSITSLCDGKLCIKWWH